ncbi:hypothetical protein HY498_02755 [Candidatus Woesearchaeota archaeon]|nr:hypothetical protein [Candidatus Woesearchaeota archaeon]
MAVLIKKIVKDIKEELLADKSIISLTLVGSFSNPHKSLEKFNDLDLVIICNKLNKSLFDSLKQLINLLKNKYSSGKLGITSSSRIGPIKIKSAKEKTTMIHFLIYTLKGYKKYESTLTRFSFQHYKPLIGIPLLQISKVSSVSPMDLFNKIDGIPAMKHWIEKKEIFYLEPTSKGVKIIKGKLNKVLYLEVLFYSVLRLSSNMLRTKNIYAETDLAMCKQFEKEFLIELNRLPYEIYNLKTQLRKGRIFEKNEIESVKKKSLEFIRECEDILKK